MMKPDRYAVYDVSKVVEGMGVSERHARRLGKDGRAISYWVTAKIATECQFEVVKDHLESLDLHAKPPVRDYMLVRMLTKVVNFSRSANHGVHRDDTFKEGPWKDWVKNFNNGILVVDTHLFPSMPMWIIQPSTLIDWYEGGQLKRENVVAKNPKGGLVREKITLTRKQFYKLVEAL